MAYRKIRPESLRGLTLMKKIQLFVFTAIRVVINTAHRMIYPFLSVFARGLGVDVGVITTLVANRAIIGSLDPFIFPFIEPRGRKFGMLLGMGGRPYAPPKPGAPKRTS